MEEKLQSDNKKILIKLCLYPAVVLLMMLTIGIISYFGPTEKQFSFYLILIIISPLLGIAGIVNLCKGTIRYRNIEHKQKKRYLIAGLILNGAVLSIPLLIVITNNIHNRNRERHNDAIRQIVSLERDLQNFRFSYGTWPSQEGEGLKELEKLRLRDNFWIDPWGKPYNYRLEKPVENSKEPIPYVWSSGPDRISGTDDDIDAKTPHRHRYICHWPSA